MVTVVAVQVLKGSHALGRINHMKVGGQMGADMERVEQVMKVRNWRGGQRNPSCSIIRSSHTLQVLPLVEVEMEPGDALFFHSNVLHRSDQNNSDRRRWAFLVAYNRASNNPTFKHHHPQYTKLNMVCARDVWPHTLDWSQYQI